MIISPYYAEIKTRALEILRDPAGYRFEGVSQRDILAWKRPKVSREAVDEALCMARDECHARHQGESGRSVWTVVRFNAGNFLKAKRELVFEIKMAAVFAGRAKGRHYEWYI